MSEALQKIYDQHDVVCNQKYGDCLPYSFHLKAVVAQVDKYIGCITVPKFVDPGAQYIFHVNFHEKLQHAAAGHDLIEDARMTYNDVVELLGKEIADIIYACTECKGHNRTERHSQEFFDTLKANRLAVFVKLCDIMANILFSMLTNSSMLEKYKKELPNIHNQLYIEGEYEDLWNDLYKLIG